MRRKGGSLHHCRVHSPKEDGDEGRQEARGKHLHAASREEMRVQYVSVHLFPSFRARLSNARAHASGDMDVSNSRLAWCGGHHGCRGAD